jgi:uncharacterized protein
MAKRVGVLAAVLLAAFVCTTATAAAASFSALGSAEQVYVTGLKPSQQMQLVDSAGKTVQTRKASFLGGLLFREVTPGSGYRVRAVDGGEQSDPLTVLSTDATPPSTDV